MSDRELLEAIADAVEHLVGREHTRACDTMRGTLLNIYDPTSGVGCTCGRDKVLALLAKARHDNRSGIPEPTKGE